MSEALTDYSAANRLLSASANAKRENHNPVINFSVAIYVT